MVLEAHESVLLMNPAECWMTPSRLHHLWRHLAAFNACLDIEFVAFFLGIETLAWRSGRGGFRRVGLGLRSLWAHASCCVHGYFVFELPSPHILSARPAGGRAWQARRTRS